MLDDVAAHKELTEFGFVLDGALTQHDVAVVTLTVDTLDSELRDLTEAFPERKDPAGGPPVVTARPSDARPPFCRPAQVIRQRSQPCAGAVAPHRSGPTSNSTAYRQGLDYFRGSQVGLPCPLAH